MSNIGADLPAGHQEIQRRHPLFGAEAGLPGEVVEVLDEAGHDVRQPGVRALRVDPDRVGRDVVDGQVQQRRRSAAGRRRGAGAVGRGRFRGHCGGMVVVEDEGWGWGYGGVAWQLDTSGACLCESPEALVARTERCKWTNGLLDRRVCLGSSRFKEDSATSAQLIDAGNVEANEELCNAMSSATLLSVSYSSLTRG